MNNFDRLSNPDIIYPKDILEQFRVAILGDIELSDYNNVGELNSDMFMTNDKSSPFYNDTNHYFNYSRFAKHYRNISKKLGTEMILIGNG